MPVSEKVINRLIKLGKSRKAAANKKLEEEQERQKQQRLQQLELQRQQSTNQKPLSPPSTNGIHQGRPLNGDTQNNSNWLPGVHGAGKLSNDTINIIHKFYCRDCQMMEERKAQEKKKEGKSSSTSSSPSSSSTSSSSSDLHDQLLRKHPQNGPISPQTTLEELSLQMSMDKNKESLKRKLLLRRSVTELVDQGIYPPLKTPPAFAEQRRQLERAKTGDLLKHKIQHRPDRQALVNQNILTEESSAHPAIVDKQRILKRAKLLDGLNDRLSHRPGPLELVEANVLPSNELHDAIKDGSVHFNRTCEGEDPLRKDRHFLFDEESISDGIPSPSHVIDDGEHSQASQASQSCHSLPSPPDIKPLQLNISQTSFLPRLAQPPVSFPGRTSPGHTSPQHHSTMGFLLSQPSTSFSTPSPTNSIGSISSVSSTASSKTGSSSSNGSKLSTSSKVKKTKLKCSGSKAKIIKFHEYKGPPNALKNQQANCDPSGTPYHILLQQQQLFLQWQLEMQQQQKTLQPFSVCPTQAVAPQSRAPTPPQPSVIKLERQKSPPPAPPVPSVSHNSDGTNYSSSKSTSSRNLSSFTAGDPLPANLEELKVADLRAELKRRNLPVSGPKPQLINRLKPFVDLHTTKEEFLPAKTSISKILPSISLSSFTSSSDTNTISTSRSPMGTILNIQPVTPQSVHQDDTVMSLVGGNSPPPPSPTLSDINSLSGPLSPESMDIGPIFSGGTNKCQFNMNHAMSSHAITRNDSSIVNSVVDEISNNKVNLDQQQFIQSPESVVPMDVDMNSTHPMTSVNIVNNVPIDLNSSINLGQSGPINSGIPGITVKPITHEELVRIQQKQIEDLQRQLQQSQLQLAAAAHSGPHHQQIFLKPGQAQIITQPGQQPLLIQAAAQPQQSAVMHTQSVIPNMPVPTSTSQSNNERSANPPVFTGNSLHENLNAGQTKILSLSPFGNNGQFIGHILTQPPVKNESKNQSDVLKKPRANTVPINGVVKASRNTSTIPSSPVKNVNDFFFQPNIPMKDPPKYDEAIKTKQLQTQQIVQQLQAATSEHSSQDVPMSTSSTSQQPTITNLSTFLAALSNNQLGNLSPLLSKSQAMDDVLEILIRNGELPSTALDSPKTPRSSNSATKTSLRISFPHQVSSGGSLVYNSAAASEVSRNNFLQHSSGLSTMTSTTDATKTIPTAMLVAQTDVPSSPNMPSVSIKKEPPPPLKISPQIAAPGSPSNEFGSLLNDNMTNNDAMDFISMDWSGSNSNLDTLGLTVPSSMTESHKLNGNMCTMPPSCSSVASSTNSCSSIHGSEPNLNGLVLDPDNQPTMNIDISDWLDVIMPTTNNTLTPMSANAPITFPSDPILTPKPQEILDIFNMDESDFNTPTDLTSGLSWERMMESLSKT